MCTFLILWLDMNYNNCKLEFYAKYACILKIFLVYNGGIVGIQFSPKYTFILWDPQLCISISSALFIENPT